MRMLPRYFLSAATAALALAGLAWAGSPPAASAAGGREEARSLAPVWADRFVQGGSPTAAAASATAVFVTGGSASRPNGRAFATEACAAATGARLWSARYKFPGTVGGFGNAIAASPDGSAVFVAGSDFGTIGYDAATGARLWATRYNGPVNYLPPATSIAVSPDGSKVLVTGISFDPKFAEIYLTVAYDARTGAQLWAQTYNGGTEPSSIAVSPGGRAAYVTGYGPAAGGGSRYVTVAYNLATGARLWVARYRGQAKGGGQARQVAVSKDGHEVAVTGYTQGAGADRDYATVAYNAADGAQLWARRYGGPRKVNDTADGLAFGPGGTLYVTGSSGFYSGSAYATIAYTAAHGRQLWASRYSTPGKQTTEAVGIKVALAGGQLYVTGTADGGRRGINTVAYNTANGKAVWVSRYPQPGNSTAVARAIAINRKFVFAIGHTGTGGGYITLAYPAA